MNFQRNQGRFRFSVILALVTLANLGGSSHSMARQFSELRRRSQEIQRELTTIHNERKVNRAQANDLKNGVSTDPALEGPCDVPCNPVAGGLCSARVFATGGLDPAT